MALRVSGVTWSDGSGGVFWAGVTGLGDLPRVVAPVVARHTGRSCPSVDVEIAHDAEPELVTSSGAGSMPRDP